MSNGSDVDQDERRKAIFLSAYRRLCLEHGIMVCMLEKEDSDYEAYFAIDFSLDPSQLDQAITEMGLNELRYATSEEHGAKEVSLDEEEYFEQKEADEEDSEGDEWKRPKRE